MKTIVITGAGSGIGRAVALELAAPDVHIVAVGRRPAPLEETARGCRENGAKAGVITLDVRDRDAVHAALGRFKDIHGIVANSGVCARTPLDEDISDAIFDEVMLTNVQGVWNTFRAVHAHLVDGARAVAVSSGLGKLARPGYAAYAASKHAVLGIVKCLALELAPRGIRVNAVCPGWVDTEMAMADLDHSARERGTSREAEMARAVSDIPLGRFVAPEDVARLVAWLMSDAASTVTAQSYNISGGEFFV